MDSWEMSKQRIAEFQSSICAGCSMRSLRAALQLLCITVMAMTGSLSMHGMSPAGKAVRRPRSRRKCSSRMYRRRRYRQDKVSEIESCCQTPIGSHLSCSRERDQSRTWRNSQSGVMQSVQGPAYDGGMRYMLERPGFR